MDCGEKNGSSKSSNTSTSSAAASSATTFNNPPTSSFQPNDIVANFDEDDDAVNIDDEDGNWPDLVDDDTTNSKTTRNERPTNDAQDGIQQLYVKALQQRAQTELSSNFQGKAWLLEKSVKKWSRTCEFSFIDNLYMVQRSRAAALHGRSIRRRSVLTRDGRVF